VAKQTKAKGTTKGIGGASAIAPEGPARAPAVGLAQFVRNIRLEVRRITWPSRREARLTTISVFAMAAVAALFFFAVDYILSHAIKALLG
jgi:preprotein translocase subunit SecE